MSRLGGGEEAEHVYRRGAGAGAGWMCAASGEQDRRQDGLNSGDDRREADSGIWAASSTESPSSPSWRSLPRSRQPLLAPHDPPHTSQFGTQTPLEILHPLPRRKGKGPPRSSSLSSHLPHSLALTHTLMSTRPAVHWTQRRIPPRPRRPATRRSLARPPPHVPPLLSLRRTLRLCSLEEKGEAPPPPA